MTRLLRTLRGGVAPRVAALAATALGGPLPVRLRAWDGSEAGPGGRPVVVLHNRRALRRLLWQPGELGLAEAYIAKDIRHVETARVWRLYLAGGGLAFEQGRMGVDQILCSRPGPGISAAATDVPAWHEGLAER